MLVLTLRTLNIDFRHAMTQTNEIFIHSRQSGSKNTCILSQGFTLQTSSQSASVERVDGSLYGRVPPPSPCKHHRSWHRRWHTHTHTLTICFLNLMQIFSRTRIYCIWVILKTGRVRWFLNVVVYSVCLWLQHAWRMVRSSIYFARAP